MEGIVDIIKTNSTNGLKYGFITLENGNSLYFDSRSLSNGFKMSDFYQGDTVEYASVMTSRQGKKSAIGVKLIEKVHTESVSKEASQKIQREFYTPGYYRGMDRLQMREYHLNPNSGEYEVLQKKKNIL